MKKNYDRNSEDCRKEISGSQFFRSSKSLVNSSSPKNIESFQSSKML